LGFPIWTLKFIESRFDKANLLREHLTVGPNGQQSNIFNEEFTVIKLFHTIKGELKMYRYGGIKIYHLG
jgi:hypothetical protein